MKKLTKEQVIAMHGDLIETFGGADSIRDEGLLDSALATPFQTFGGQPMFSTIQQKAVRMGFGLIQNHPFMDGNKRIGTHVMLVLLAMNGIELEYTQKGLYGIILEIAANEASYDDLLNWVLNHEI
jgi:death-on-curing protein